MTTPRNEGPATADSELYIGPDDCVDGSGEVWPEHDYPPPGTPFAECSRCHAEPNDETEDES